MQKRFVKTLAVLFGVLFMGTALFSACKSPVDTTQTPQTQNNKTSFTGTHDFTAPDTDEYLVKNGTTEYKLVYNAENIAESKTACDEFIHLFERATGKTMQKVPDTGLTHTENAKYVSIGNTDLFESSGLSLYKQELGTDGVRIITKDKTVYILGATPDGILYSVYTFMSLTFGFETYAYNCYEIEENVTEKKLKNYNVTDIPDLAIRCAGNGTVTAKRTDYDESMYRSRLRLLGGTSRYMLPIHSEFDNKSSPSNIFHNVYNYMKAGDEGTRPEWFASKGGQQLCYTAGGDEESLAEMIDYCARKVISSLKLYAPEVYPDYNIATITIMDNNTVCSCKACTSFYKQCNDAAAAPVIPFVNGMNKIVKEWMAKEENAAYRRDNFKIIFFAYNTMVNPPVGQNKDTGDFETYTVNGKTLSLDEGTGIWYVPSFQRTTSIYDEKDKTKIMFEKWSSISDYIAIWTYSHDYTNYLYLFDSFSHFTPELYQFYAANNVEFYYPQGWFDDKNATGWKTLTTYLDAKLAWNSSLSVADLMDKYFKAMYKEAAPAMRNMFDMMRLQWQKADSEGLKIATRDAWPYQSLKAWMQTCDESIALIKELYGEQNPKLCQMAIDNIELEWLSPAYITTQFYSSGSLSPLSDVEVAALKQRFNEVRKRLNVTHVKENQPFTDL